MSEDKELKEYYALEDIKGRVGKILDELRDLYGEEIAIVKGEPRYPAELFVFLDAAWYAMYERAAWIDPEGLYSGN